MSRRRKLTNGQIQTMKSWMASLERQRVELLDGIGRMGRYAIGTERYNALRDDLRDTLEKLAYYRDCVTTGYTD